MFDFKNKVALITGGGSGIGLAYAKELLRRELKVVALVDINSESGMIAVNEIRSVFKRENCAIFIKADVTQKKELQNAFDVVVHSYKQLDIVINNAGILNEAYWKKCVAVNFTATVYGTMLATETYIPKYRSGSESLIINTASIGALIPFESTPVYCATKAGVVAFTRSMGSLDSYKINKIRIVAICPGNVATSLTTSLEEKVSEPYITAVREILRNLPQQKPEEVVKTALDAVINATTGSVWTVTHKGCEKLEFPVF